MKRLIVLSAVLALSVATIPLSRAQGMEVVGHCAALAGLPACRIGRLQTADGLTVYVVLCAELYDRDGTPYADADDPFAGVRRPA